MECHSISMKSCQTQSSVAGRKRCLIRGPLWPHEGFFCFWSLQNSPAVHLNWWLKLFLVCCSKPLRHHTSSCPFIQINNDLSDDTGSHSAVQWGRGGPPQRPLVAEAWVSHTESASTAFIHTVSSHAFRLFQEQTNHEAWTFISHLASKSCLFLNFLYYREASSLSCQDHLSKTR